eukprot:5670478-Prorocentrum_lima.AAC.1
MTAPGTSTCITKADNSSAPAPHRHKPNGGQRDATAGPPTQIGPAHEVQIAKESNCAIDDTMRELRGGEK